MSRLKAYVAALVVLGSQPITPAQTFETIYTLPDPGTNSQGSLVKASNGAFLGTAATGGGHPGSKGAVFQVSAQGQITRLIGFNGENGGSPSGGLTMGADGKYYGVMHGGKNGKGTVFRITVSGEFEEFVSFPSKTAPMGQLTLGSDGNFYGIGSKNGIGIIFRLTPAKVLSVVAEFDPPGPNEIRPVDGLVEIEGETRSFFGVAHGGASQMGVIFKCTAAGTIETLVEFTGANGAWPSAAIVKGSDGNYYGTTELGGAAGVGTIFKITSVGAFSTVASFHSIDGNRPQGRLLERDGTFYGITESGGADNKGTVFKITPGDASPVITTVADLNAEVGAQGRGGLVFGDDDNLYGATGTSGAANWGTVIKITPSGTVTKLADLGPVNGEGFIGGVVPGPDNSLFGAAIYGGATRAGTLFRLTTNGAFTKLVDFDIHSSGGNVGSRIIVGSDQILRGSSSYSGGLFSATLEGTFLAAPVTPGINNPNGIIEASDGAFYGTSSGYGSGQDDGCVFRFTKDGPVEILFHFNGNTGRQPEGPLVEGPDGALYGTTTFGGAFDKGTVFRITKTGAFGTLANFNGDNGAQPSGPLVVGKDGNFYGAAPVGGPNGKGTVFRVSPTGNLKRLAVFNGINGAHPHGGLAVGPGGNLYGVASAGEGKSKFGTLFKVSIDGRLTVLHRFDGMTNGAFPTSTLCVGPDGNLYGTTYSTVFRLLTSNRAPVATNDSFELPVIQKKVFSNDSDPDKDPLTIVSVTDGAHGTVEFTKDGTVTYLPGPDFDTESVQSDSFTYTISDGLGGTATATVAVTVPSNLFRAGAGAYGGVLTLNGSAQGYWALGLTGAGGFAGAIYVDGVKTPIKGSFLPDGTFTQIVTRKAPLTPLTVNLQLDSIRNIITGSVVSGMDTYSVELTRNLPIYSPSRPNPNTGRYTVLLTPNQFGELFPAGTGYAKLTVTAKGAVAIVGMLGDGAPFAAGSFISSEGEVPIYAQTYLKKKGYVSGLLTFANLQESDVSGTLYWNKPAQPTDASYPEGFSTTANLIGARYLKVPPVLPFPPLLYTNASLIFDGMATAPLIISKSNVVQVAPPITSRTKIKIDSNTGFFTGSYVDPIGGAWCTFGGVFYQKGTNPRGEGLFFKEAGTGKATIVPVTN